MAKLKPGAIMIDLVDQGVYGDLDHCPKEDLLESAQALLDILPLVQHRGIWGLSKAYDNDVYVYTIGKDFKVPADLPLATHNGKPARALVMAGASRERYWTMTWYERTVGSIKERQVSAHTINVPDHYREAPASTYVQGGTGRGTGGQQRLPL